MRNSLLWTAMFAILALLLYDVKYNVRTEQSHTHALERELIEERKRLHMVELEWARLSRPERIAELAQRHLDLRSTAPAQLMDTSQAVLRSVSQDGAL